MDQNNQMSMNSYLNYRDYIVTSLADGREFLMLAYEKETAVGTPVYEELHTEPLDRDFEDSLEGHIQFLRGIATDVPDGCKAVIRFVVERDYEGGRDVARCIGYYRAPTDEEIASRKDRNKRVRAAKKALKEQAVEKERREFERLKAKFA